ncbi:ectoine hydroxylase-related dioxygenase (phytanoyl-CoA dioxygenase family) [Friedmanniella endophytica]|uniref:Ectoine hydroxylase-related dioxygenase (Phytanoyl-CoA dioxygenase family) n=1 Tax=Microlunatus kandeliicorticis TaxID=1759536 RepID=A0A7W3IVU4_9ACTN|nr:phytanoyl-CoA dioxygenase family protein [Microlunatus kandeliicorticis]MBA8796223.1 ectoine hydroxylase-related dioxygenase (phytanoyl-CoA dioxygenase family) [Microlunatus kandeliicorticis]
MTETLTSPLLDLAVVEQYRTDGFVHLPGVLDAAEVERYRTAAAEAYEHGQALDPDSAMFKQVVNVWRTDPVLRDLTLHPRLATLATELAGMPLRIWHDQLLMKRPHNATPTEYHQDAPYWPHAGCRHALSAWVALVDVPVERGCMTFIPGQQDRHDIRAIDLADATDLFEAAPDLVWTRRITIPLRAGDVTFHNGYTPHTANANETDEFRFAHVNIYVDRETRYDGRPHVCTDGLGLAVGGPFPDDRFPPVP